jgi:hypothetical protein
MILSFSEIVSERVQKATFARIRGNVADPLSPEKRPQRVPFIW